MANVVTLEGSPHSVQLPQTRPNGPESPSHTNLRAPNKRRQRDFNRAALAGKGATTARH
ncbi:hypothetical protein BDW02DRAFT_616667 [Decorospora gaudefroyi]|uniref:Uncharacterized protein n=1 Tax=Decorospora gaudefroyi TaxID=184978 RepID=A0A6A5JVF8_9PLEO|nr:hypothetical protein BDW02DRAFT_616667 [Decorospora gaudefroyi]